MPVEIVCIEDERALPAWAPRERLVRFFHEVMKPYEDAPADVARGLDYGLGDAPGTGGFLLLAHRGGELVGGLLMLETGMKGYVPENLLLFIAVRPALRGRGIGGRLIDRARQRAEGAIKLHVEPDNPARRLYERKGFENPYLEMRMDP